MRLAAMTSRRRSISLTPLIDVVFILLIFFMLASSFLDWHSIDLMPPGGAGGTVEGSVLIDILPDGLRFAGRAQPLETIASELTARLLPDSPLRVLLKPAKDIVLQEMMVVLDRLGQIDGIEVSIIRDQKG